MTGSAARDFGLLEGTPVGASLIDAHAGGVGTIGGRGKSDEPVDVCRRLAYIMGTSACIMATTSEPCFVPGVWGPYYSGMVPGFWLNEGGQSAAGAAIDHLIKSHPAYDEAVAAAQCCRHGNSGISRTAYRLARSANPGEAALFARDIHVLPEFLGNRSPFADPDSRAIVAGMDLDADIGSMERLFVAGLCGLAYGLADVVDAFRSHGVDSDLMVISGGAGRSSLVRQIMADTTGLTVAVPETQEPVLLGAAMLGAVAGGLYGSIGEAMASMSAIGWLSEPTAPGMADFHRTEAAGPWTDAKTGSGKPRCDARDRIRSPVLTEERDHAAELRRCPGRFPARQIHGRARRHRAGGRGFLPQHRRRHGASRRRRRDLSAAFRPICSDA